MIRNLLILDFLFIFSTLTSSSPSFFNESSLSPCPPPFNFDLLGTSIADHNSITLTQHLHQSRISNPLTNYGRVFHKNPIEFLDSSSHSTVSFSTRFSFKIIPPPPPYLSGYGLAFLITSNPNALPHSIGCFPKSPQCDFMAVEFDTNDNHLGINLDSYYSVFSVDLKNINLKSGKQITAWIIYRNTEKVIKIWVGYHNRKPESPILVAPIDLSERLNRLMFVGISAYNGRGSSIHILNSWYFKTSSSVEDEDVGPENCLICFPKGLVGEEGEIVSRNNRRAYKSLVVLAITLLAALTLIRVRLIPRLATIHGIMRNQGQNGRLRMYDYEIRPIRRRRRFRRLELNLNICHLSFLIEKYSSLLAMHQV